jgi:hypothetical protein
MAVSNKKACAICGTEYNYCPSCERNAGYKYYADKPECYQVFMVLSEVREGTLTETEAAEQFNQIGIDTKYDFTKFIPSVADDIKRIVSKVDGKTEEKANTKKK